MAKNLLYLLALILYPLGTVNGIYYAIIAGEWYTVLGIVFLAAMAWPTEKMIFKRIFVDDDTT